jgi:hypothetical protein
LRVPYGENSFKSADSAAVTVSAVKTPEEKPVIAIDYIKEELTGFVSGGEYTLDGNALTLTGMTAAITDAMLGKTVKIVKKGDGTSTTDSAAQELAVPARPAAPTGIEGGKGEITGFAAGTAYQIKKGVDGTWINAGSVLDGKLAQAAGAYSVRLAAVAGSSFASEAVSVTVSEKDEPPVAELTKLAVIITRGNTTGRTIYSKINGYFSIPYTEDNLSEGNTLKLRPEDTLPEGTVVSYSKLEVSSNFIDSISVSGTEATVKLIPGQTSSNPVSNVKITVDGVDYEIRLYPAVQIIKGNISAGGKITFSNSPLAEFSPSSNAGRMSYALSPTLSYSLEAVPDAGYKLKTLTVNGEAVDGAAFTFALNASKAYTVNAEFELVTEPPTSNPPATEPPATAPPADTVPVASVALDQTSAAVNMGGWVVLTAKIDPENATNKAVSWSSSNEAVAKVETVEGSPLMIRVIPVSVGTAAITVTTADGAKSAACNINVTVYVDNTPPGGGGGGTAATATPVPTAAPAVSGEPEASPSGEPGATPGATAAPTARPAATPVPGATDEPDVTDEPETPAVTRPPLPAVVPLPEPEVAAVGILPTVNATTGAVTASATEAEMAEQIEQFSESAGIISLEVDGVDSVTSLEVEVPASAIEKIVSGTEASLQIKAGETTLTLDNTALAAVQAASGDSDVITIVVNAVETETMPAAVQDVIGERPVYDLAVMKGSTRITEFEGGSVTVFLPYTLKEGERPASLVVYYLDGEGGMEAVRSRYNAERGGMEFVAKHFSTYAVGYRTYEFSDVSSGAWYYDAVSFAASRGITTGTGSGNFSPNRSLTRGEFIVMLMRAYNIRPDAADSEDNFSDVESTDFYAGYTAAAKRLSITAGTGNNNFGADMTVSREMMFQLVYNVLSAINELPNVESGPTIDLFDDSDIIGSYYITGMNALVQCGVVGSTSVETNVLSPQAQATRATMAQVLYNLLAR